MLFKSKGRAELVHIGWYIGWYNDSNLACREGVTTCDLISRGNISKYSASCDNIYFWGFFEQNDAKKQVSMGTNINMLIISVSSAIYWVALQKVKVSVQKTLNQEQKGSCDW